MFPKQIDRYEIVGVLGQGGMATVYLARDMRFRRDVALKVLPKEFLHDPTFRLRFEREALTVASLEHPAIVPVYDFGEEAGQPYIVMRYMAGGSLADRLNQQPLTLADAARILTRLAPALDAAHAQGIIHRDLKPGNILFDQHGNPHLSDFGLVKLTASAGSVTGGAMIGTPAYMSPEQARGRGTLDGRSDIYSLGAMLYEMLAGAPPYEADTPIGQAIKHVTEPVPRIRSLNPDLSPDCEAIIARAMDKDPAKRFAKVVDLAAALEQIADGHTPLLKPVPEADTPTVHLPAAAAPLAAVGQKRQARVPIAWIWIATGLIVLCLAGASLTAAVALQGTGFATATPTATSSAVGSPAPTVAFTPIHLEALNLTPSPPQPAAGAPASTSATAGDGPAVAAPPSAVAASATATRTGTQPTLTTTTTPSQTEVRTQTATPTPSVSIANSLTAAALTQSAANVTATRTSGAPTPSATMTPAQTQTATRTAVATASNTPVPTATPNQTQTPTATTPPSATPTSTATATPSDTPTPSDTQPPAISKFKVNPRNVRPPNSCASQFSADIDDASGVAAASVQWMSYDPGDNMVGSGAAAMTLQSGSTWSVSFGVMVPDNGRLEWSVQAVDTAGNSSTQPSGINVEAKNGACP